MNLITLAIQAPWTGVDPEDPWTLHGITMEACVDGWEPDNHSFAAACGVPGLKVWAWKDEPILWPPRVKGLPPRLTRCRECHRLTGRRAPRCSFIEEKVNA